MEKINISGPIHEAFKHAIKGIADYDALKNELTDLEFNRALYIAISTNLTLYEASRIEDRNIETACAIKRMPHGDRLIKMAFKKQA